VWPPPHSHSFRITDILIVLLFVFGHVFWECFLGLYIRIYRFIYQCYVLWYFKGLKFTKIAKCVLYILYIQNCENYNLYYNVSNAYKNILHCYLLQVSVFTWRCFWNPVFCFEHLWQWKICCNCWLKCCYYKFVSLI
jgi:hypothetical protein